MRTYISYVTYVNMTIMTYLGGDSSVGTMMSDVYSVNFKSTLRHWMETINDYPKPFNFVFVPLTDFLENMADFMIDDDCKAQCFNEAVLAKRSTFEQAGQAQADQGRVL